MLYKENAYVRRLMIIDHIREVHAMYDRYKAKEIKWQEIQKELADLLILLRSEVTGELFLQREQRFKEKDENEAGKNEG
jgi:hypothetical protein